MLGIAFGLGLGTVAGLSVSDEVNGLVSPAFDDAMMLIKETDRFASESMLSRHIDMLQSSHADWPLRVSLHDQGS
jgi:hypothetical protein